MDSLWKGVHCQHLIGGTDSFAHNEIASVGMRKALLIVTNDDHSDDQHANLLQSLVKLGVMIVDSDFSSSENNFFAVSPIHL